MKRSALLSEIREVNLSYLMLAQQMVREDRDEAMFRLGIGADTAGILDQLSPQQIVKMAGSSTLVARPRFDDHALLGLLSGYGEARGMPEFHASILMAGQPAGAAA